MARELDGSSDLILPVDNANTNNVFSNGATIFTALYADTMGGGSNARWFQSRTPANVAAPSLKDLSGNDAKIGFLHVFSGDNGIWDMTNRDFPLDEWNLTSLRYDGSSTANDPEFDVNGSSIAVSETTAPTGTVSGQTDEFRIGNTASIRGWDGFMSYCVCWSVILSDNEVTALGHGVNPFAIRNDSLNWFFPLYGHESPEEDYVAQTSNPTLTGTSKPNANPPVELLENYL